MKHAVKHNLKTLRTRWYVWLFPIVAIILSAFLIQQYYYNNGFVIHISFDDASVIQVAKTKLKFRGVDIGRVKDVTISDDQKHVVVSVQLNKGTDHFAVEGSKFWVVTPKVSLQGLTGLDTIFSGPYIDVLPGPADAPIQTEFKGKTQEVTSDENENMSSYILETASAESLNPGDAITYRGVHVGTVGKMSLGKTAQMIEVQILIQNKYSRLVRSNTVFWNKVGIQAKLGLFGSKIKVNSMDSIMHGGIEFATPDKAEPMAKANAKFILAPEAPKNSEKWNPVLE